MPNYENSKIVSIGLKDHTVGSPDSFLFATTTTKKALLVGDLRRKYKNYLLGIGREQPYYHIIDKLGPENLTSKLVAEKPCQNKAELNLWLIDTEKQLNDSTKELIQENKKDIKEITRVRYEANIDILKRRMEETNPLFYNDYKKVLTFIKESGWAGETQKNYLKALIALLPNTSQVKKYYKEALIETDNKTQGQRDLNEKSATQTDKWVDYPVLLQKYEELKQKGISKKLILASFYSGVFFAPYRVKELLYMKVRNYRPTTDNYIDWEKREFVLNVYKTSADYGMIRQKIPDEFYEMLKEYVKKVKGDYLFGNSKGEQSSYYELNKEIKEVYGCGASLIRNIYITNLYKKSLLKSNKEMKEVAKEMRNSVQVMLEYRKLS